MTKAQLIKATAYALSVHSPLPSDIPHWSATEDGIFKYTIIVPSNYYYAIHDMIFAKESTIVKIDWGDGQIDEYSNPPGISLHPNHTYETSGMYTITIYSYLQSVMFDGGSYETILYSIDSKIPYSKNISTLSGVVNLKQTSK